MNQATTELFTTTVDLHIQRGARSAEKFEEKLRTNGINYALKWAEDTARDTANAELWTQVKTRYEAKNLNPVQAIESVNREVTRRLLANHVVERSTSAFSNATSLAVADAHARFHEQATGLIEALQLHDAK